MNVDKQFWNRFLDGLDDNRLVVPSTWIWTLPDEWDQLWTWYRGWKIEQW